MQECVVKEPVVWETQRKGVPGKLTFDVLKDNALSFEEGNAVRFEVNGKIIFFGFVFSKSRKDNTIISVVAYDQLRYFKNKDTYVYGNKTASQVLQMLIKDFNLNAGSIDDTKHIISSRIEDDQELFAIVQNGLDETLQSTKRMYVLRDNAGKLDLKEVNALKSNILIDETSGESFSYSTSIDEKTYNRVKLIYENSTTGKREVYIAQDSSTMNTWGILQLTEKLDNNTNAKLIADTALSIHNRKSRRLDFSKLFGDVSCFGGATVAVKMNLGDINVAHFMLIESAKHSFYSDVHFMDLKLIGGDFVA